MRGGKREGSGRPKIDPKKARVQLNTTIDPYIKRFIDSQQEPNCRIIERALKALYGLY